MAEEDAAALFKTFHIMGLSGRIVQGSFDAVRSFYTDPVLASNALIVNVAKRAGETKVEDREVTPPENGDPFTLRIFWLPMSEGMKKKACEQYMTIHGAELVAALRTGKTVVVHCQEGLHRSVEFARQLLELASGGTQSDATKLGDFAEESEDDEKDG